MFKKLPLPKKCWVLLQLKTLRANVLPSLVPSRYEPHFSKNPRYAVSCNIFAIVRLRKNIFYGKFF